MNHLDQTFQGSSTNQTFYIRGLVSEHNGMWWVLWLLGPMGIMLSLALKYFFRGKSLVETKSITMGFSSITFSAGFFKDGFEKTFKISAISKVEYVSNNPGILQFFTYSDLPFNINGEPKDLKKLLEALENKGVQIEKIIPLSTKIFYVVLIGIILFLIYGFFKAKTMVENSEVLGLLMNM